MSDIEKFREEIENSVELHRKRVSTRIVTESERLVEELLKIIYSEDLDVDGRPVVDAKTKLSAITILLDRGVPKLAVDNTKSGVIEVSGTRKKIREEIENMMKKDKEKE